MFSKLFKGVSSLLGPQGLTQEEIQINADNVLLETERSLRNIVANVQAAIDNINGGMQEVVPIAQRYMVASCSPLESDLPRLYLGDLIWKMVRADGSYEYYRACDISLRGEYFVRRSENHLCKVLVEKEIAKKTIVQVGDVSYDLPVRVLRSLNHATA